MPALVTMLLFVFLLVVAIALTIWSALTLAGRTERDDASDAEEDFIPAALSPRVSNDAFRGARASVKAHVPQAATPPQTVAPRQADTPRRVDTVRQADTPRQAEVPKQAPVRQDDAFERFLRAERKD